MDVLIHGLALCYLRGAAAVDSPETKKDAGTVRFDQGFEQGHAWDKQGCSELVHCTLFGLSMK